jgi:hypothetical protein
MRGRRSSEFWIVSSEFSDRRASAFNHQTLARHLDGWPSLVGLVQKFRYTQTNKNAEKSAGFPGEAIWFI